MLLCVEVCHANLFLYLNVSHFNFPVKTLSVFPHKKENLQYFIRVVINKCLSLVQLLSVSGLYILNL